MPMTDLSSVGKAKVHSAIAVGDDCQIAALLTSVVRLQPLRTSP
jgi:hypothetical protein